MSKPPPPSKRPDDPTSPPPSDSSSPSPNTKAEETLLLAQFTDYPEENLNPADETEQWEIDTRWLKFRQRCLFKWWMQELSKYGSDELTQCHIVRIWRNGKTTSSENQEVTVGPYSSNTGQSPSSWNGRETDKGYWTNIVGEILETADAAEGIKKRSETRVGKTSSHQITAETGVANAPKRERRFSQDLEIDTEIPRKRAKLSHLIPSEDLKSPRNSPPPLREVQQSSHFLSLKITRSKALAEFQKLVRPYLSTLGPVASDSGDLAEDEGSDDENPSPRAQRHRSRNGAAEVAPPTKRYAKRNMGRKIARMSAPKRICKSALRKTSTPKTTPTRSSKKTPKSSEQYSADKAAIDKSPVENAKVSNTSDDEDSEEDNLEGPRYDPLRPRPVEPNNPYLIYRNIKIPIDPRIEQNTRYPRDGPFLTTDETAKGMDAEDLNLGLTTTSLDELSKGMEDSGKGAGDETKTIGSFGKSIVMEIDEKEASLEKFHIAPSYNLGGTVIVRMLNRGGSGFNSHYAGTSTSNTQYLRGLLPFPPPMQRPMFPVMPPSIRPAFERQGISSWPGAGCRYHTLHGWDLHRLACNELLIGTKYQFWRGLFEAMRYFKEETPLNVPLADPHIYVRVPIDLFPEDEPMLMINRFVKALWELDKSLRVLMRAAIVARPTQVDKHNFWVESYFLHPTTAQNLANFITTRSGLTVFPIDQEGFNPPRKPIMKKWKIRFNLLDLRGYAPAYGDPNESLHEIWKWVFGEDKDQLIRTMRRKKELSNPLLTSYKYPVARPYFENLWEGMNSPAVSPSAGDYSGGFAPLVI